MKELIVRRLGDDPSIRYAAAQFKHYQHRATGVFDVQLFITTVAPPSGWKQR